MKYIPVALTFFALFLLNNLTNKLYSQSNDFIYPMTYQEFCNEQNSFNSSDGIVKYIDKGEGKVILLLHGVPTSSWLYRKMIPGLLKGGYRVIVPDMLGFGNSDNPEAYEIYSQDQHAKRIIELMDSLEIENWTHVFHDAGGLWTWELLDLTPDRVSNLVVLNSIIYEEGFNPPVRMKKGAFAKFVMWLYRNGVTTNSLLRSLFKVGLKENNLSKNDIEGYKRPLREGKTGGMYYFFSQTCNHFPDYSDVFETVDCPTTLIWGEHDEMLQWNPQREKVIKSFNIEDKDIHIIDAKHFIQEEKPEMISDLILKFLK